MKTINPAIRRKNAQKDALPNSLLSLPDLCKVLSVSKMTLARLLGFGLPCYQITLTGGCPHRRFDLNEVLTWLRKRENSKPGHRGRKGDGRRQNHQ